MIRGVVLVRGNGPHPTASTSHRTVTKYGPDCLLTMVTG